MQKKLVIAGDEHKNNIDNVSSDVSRLLDKVKFIYKLFKHD